MEPSTAKKFPPSPKDYKLYEEVGEGVSATVYRALCVPLNETVAIKVLDLEKCNNDLDGIRREVQTMNLIDHQNVLRAHCSFPAGHSLWVVMPYMAGGSCLHIMKTAYPEGFEEPVIATLLRETLKALVYLHSEGHIHRDVKAGNILIDHNGAVKLADFGVSACMFDTGDRQWSRNTFVGTPCWMAPEVMQQLHGYDFKADIWSFGITALELAHGHAPFSKYPPRKVLLMTLQNSPPGLDYERDRRFSKSFKELVATCLVKDPKKRPTSEKLLKHHFFKNARSNEYLAHSILDGLTPLGERFKMLKEKEADLLVHNKALYGDKEQLSQQEYIRGISAWNFNIDDLKSQAALIRGDELPNAEDPNMNAKQRERLTYNDVGISTNRLSPDRVNHSSASPTHEDSFNDLHDLENSLASFPIKPLQALKGCFDVSEENVGITTPKWNGTGESVREILTKSSPRAAVQEYERMESENIGQSSSVPHHITTEPKKFSSGSLGANLFFPRRITVYENREQLQPKYPPERYYSGPLLNRQKRDGNNVSSVEDVSDGAIIKLKGRFKVTSGDLNSKGPTNSQLNAACGCPTLKFTAASILPSMQSILQQNVVQREEIVKMIKYVEQNSGKQVDSGEMSSSDILQLPPITTREKELQCVATGLQQSIKSLTEELQKQKLQNLELERLLNARKDQG